MKNYKKKILYEDNIEKNRKIVDNINFDLKDWLYVFLFFVTKELE